MATKSIKSETVSFTLPQMMKLELSAIPETGYYDSSSEFLRDAMRSLFKERKDLRLAIASILYKNEDISLGKAVEISGTSYSEMKKILSEKGIKLKRGTTTVNEMEKGLKDIKKWKKSK